MRNGGATCQCGLATRLVGDGCERCNPQLAIQLLKEQVADMRLTDAEREAIEFFAEACKWWSTREGQSHVAVIRGLLDRTK
jgi:hypothetical protein